MNTKKFIEFDSLGNPWGVVSAEQLWGNVYAVKYNRPEIRLGKEQWKNLLHQAHQASVEFGAEVIETRIRLEYESELFRSIFTEIGLSKKAGRIEYQSEVANLPDENGTPLIWKSAEDLNWNAGEIALFTKRVVSGALDVDPNENPEDFIQDWLHHDELTFGASCIGIGFIGLSPIALVVAQVHQESGWSRLSYLGVVPEARGLGLGKWVHRHGFEMMKSQGGKLYHGGTHSENLPMRKLFESHGCRQYGEMEEWSMRIERGIK